MASSEGQGPAKSQEELGTQEDEQDCYHEYWCVSCTDVGPLHDGFGSRDSEAFMLRFESFFRDRQMHLLLLLEVCM